MSRLAQDAVVDTMPAAVPADHEEAAKDAAREAHLRYVHDDGPGIRRERAEDGTFRYRHVSDGKLVTDEPTLKRIQALGLPPAYEDVWICALPNGHLQATGRDARGRKQYRYHERWRAIRDATKYDRMLAFGEALPHIRAHVDADMRRPGLPRDKVLATIVHLLEKTRIRVGNEEYAQSNASYGLTTLRNQHVDVDGKGGGTVHFHFKGKSGIKHAIDLRGDRRAARIVANCQELPGQRLFQYVDADGTPHPIDSGDVNEYLRAAAGGESFTAKDFRTWAGTVLCALCLAECDAADSSTALKHQITNAIKHVSTQLGNTPAICRKCYVHPVVLESFTAGTMARDLHLPAEKAKVSPAAGDTALSPEESAVLHYLEDCLHKN